MSKTWIKLYPEMIGHPKLRTLPVEARWCWVGILCLAGRCDQGDGSGRLEWKESSPLGDAEIAESLGVTEDSWSEAQAAFVRRGMLYRDGETYVVASYAERQESSDRTAAARKRRQRQRNVEDNRDCHGDVTRDSHGDVTINVTAMSRVEAEAEAEADSIPAAKAAGAGSTPENSFRPDPPPTPSVTAEQRDEILAALRSTPGWEQNDKLDYTLVNSLAKQHRQVPGIAVRLLAAAYELQRTGGVSKDGIAFRDLRRVYGGFVKQLLAGPEPSLPPPPKEQPVLTVDDVLAYTLRPGVPGIPLTASEARH